MPYLDGADDGEDLLGHHREHLQVYPVKLVKTRPGARRGQTLEELSHTDVLQAKYDYTVISTRQNMAYNWKT